MVPYNILVSKNERYINEIRTLQWIKKKNGLMAIASESWPTVQCPGGDQ